MRCQRRPPSRLGMDDSSRASNFRQKRLGVTTGFHLRATMDLKESEALDPWLHVPDPVSASGESGEEEVPSSAQIPRDSDSEEEECSDADCHILTRHKDSSHLPDIEYSTDVSNEALSNDLYAPDSDLDRQQRDEEYEEAQDSAVKKGPGKGKTSRSKQEWIVQKRWNCSDYPLEEINSQVKHVVTLMYKVSETEAPIGKRIMILQ